MIFLKDNILFTRFECAISLFLHNNTHIQYVRILLLYLLWEIAIFLLYTPTTMRVFLTDTFTHKETPPSF